MSQKPQVSNSRPPASSFREDIQVLRGLAVTAVILYHLEIPGLSGGYLGVDVFFVVSGFVITGAMLNSDGSKKSNLISFYRRRVRRIIPASSYILLITYICSFILLPLIHIKRFTFDFVLSSLMVSNVGFAFQNFDYLNQSKTPSPFLHYWSLAIEEQFYLIWPFILIFFIKSIKKWIFPIVLVTFGIAMLSTFMFPKISFYSPFSRAWEFLIGASLHFVSRPFNSLLLKKSIRISSLIFLLASLAMADSSFPVPNVRTAIPVICTGILILTGFSVRFLSILKYVGDISYSLYLVHWPIILISTLIFGAPKGVEKVLLAVLIILISIFVFTDIERPFRYPNIVVLSNWHFVRLVIPIVFIVILGLLNGAFQTRKPQFSIITGLPAVYEDGCHTRSTYPKKEGCEFGLISATKSVMLVGDSHAAQFFPGFEQAAKNLEVRLIVATKSGCPALLTPMRRNDEGCSEWQRNVLNYINEVRPQVLFLANLTEDKNYGKKFGLSGTEWITSFRAFLEKINSSSKVVYISDTPFPFYDSAGCLYVNWKFPSRCNLEDRKSTLTTQLPSILEKSGIIVVDSRKYLCQNKTCKSVLNGYNVYRDGSHLSVAMTEIQESLFQDSLLKLLPPKR